MISLFDMTSIGLRTSWRFINAGLFRVTNHLGVITIDGAMFGIYEVQSTESSREVPLTERDIPLRAHTATGQLGDEFVEGR